MIDGECSSCVNLLVASGGDDPSKECLAWSLLGTFSRGVGLL